ncbi:MAG: PAS domain-containing sensor histidine kinase [Promethearchaeota archaeon]|nr:MAG: PAS domain-containing sensor histidine kinase [Candidatus Lokiarchaeota archaeon]
MTESNNKNKELAKTKENYQILTKNSPFSIILLNMDGNFVDLDKNSEKLFGYKREELLGKHFTFLSIHPSGFIQTTDRLFKSVINGEIIEPLDLQIRNKKGQLVWVSIIAFLVKIGEQKLIQIIIQDIEKKVLLAQKIRQSEKKYRDLAELLPDIIFKADNDLKLTYANSIAFKKFGYDRKDLKKGFNILKFVAPKDTDRAISNIRKIFKGESTKPNEYLILKKDGTTFSAQINSRPIYQDGKIVGISGVIHDISDLIDAKEKLKESEEKFRTITRTSPNLIFIFDSRARVLECNKSAEEALELSREKIINKKIYNLLFSLSKEQAFSTLERILKNIKNQIHDPIEFSYTSRNGKKKWYQLYYSIIKYADENCFHVELQDFSTLKMAEQIIREENEKLMELDEIRKNFIDIASHELKSPLSAVYGSLQFFYDLNREKLDKNSLELIEIAKNGSIRLKNLILNLLDISRIDSKKLKLHKQQLDLVELIKDCVNDLKYLYYKKNQSIDFELPQELYMNIDKSGFERIITNLVSNAIKYSSQHARIKVSLKSNKGNVEIFVKDEGIGLTEQEIKKLFKKFSKIERSQDLKNDINREGTGLGLYISKQIVELHNGQIWVTSEGRNKGSTFIVKLPLN